jgi:hydrogenase maturation protease
VARALIIGYGNPLRSDDGFGCYAAQELSACLNDSDVEVMALQQLTIDLAEVASHFQLVIFVDAARDCAPGEFRCERVDARRDRGQVEGSSFSHFLTPSSLLACTAELYAKSPVAYYISVGGETFAGGESISPTMRAAIGPLLVQVRALLARG